MGGLSLAELQGLLDEIAAHDDRLPAALTGDCEALLHRVMESASDADPDLRQKSCWVLGSWLQQHEEQQEAELTRAVSEVVVRLMRKDPKAKVRWTAVQCCQGLRPSPIPHLRAATKDRSAGVRYYVAFALSCYTAGWFRGDREQYRPIVIEALLRLLADTDEQVREWAALGLGIGGHRTPETRERLWAALDDPEPEVAGTAAASLVRFQDPGIREVIIRQLEVEEPAPNAFDAARKLGDPTLLPLIRQASDRFQRLVDADPRANLPRYDLLAIEVLSGTSLEEALTRRTDQS